MCFGGAGANPAVTFLRKELIRLRVEADAKVASQALSLMVPRVSRSNCSPVNSMTVQESSTDLSWLFGRHKELIRSRVEADAKVEASKPVSNKNLCLSNNLVVQIFWVVR